MKIAIDKIKVEAPTRTLMGNDKRFNGVSIVDCITGELVHKLKNDDGRFTIEAAADLNAVHGIDIEAEMMKVLQYELSQELDREILAKMYGNEKDHHAIMMLFDPISNEVIHPSKLSEISRQIKFPKLKELGFIF